MMDREIVESKTPILIVSYHDCDLCCCHLDGYRAHTDALLHRLSDIEAILVSKPAHARFRLWYNMDDTCFDKPALKSVAESLSRYRNHICQDCLYRFAGLDQMDIQRPA